MTEVLLPTAPAAAKPRAPRDKKPATREKKPAPRRRAS